MVGSGRATITRFAGYGAIAIAIGVIAYMVFLVVAGSPWSLQPEGEPRPSTSLIPVPFGPALVAIAMAALVVAGVIATFRGQSWGLRLALGGSFALTAFGAALIFGAFGLTFLVGLALMALLSVFAWSTRA